jgi:hypothetical protein
MDRMFTRPVPSKDRTTIDRTGPVATAGLRGRSGGLAPMARAIVASARAPATIAA